jgi:hypothetical protein
MANSGNSNTSRTISLVTIANRNYIIDKLQGQNNYQVWHILMTDMFLDVEVWDIVNGTSVRPSNGDSAEQIAWDKKNRATLGALRQQVNTGPMIHVAQVS